MNGKPTLVRNIGDWMLLIERDKVHMVPPGERDPDSGRDKMPLMKWMCADDETLIHARLSMTTNVQELEQDLPQMYARRIDEQKD